MKMRVKKWEFGDLSKRQAERLLTDCIRRIYSTDRNGTYSNPWYPGETSPKYREVVHDIFDLIEFNEHAAVKLFKIADIRPIKLYTLDGEVSLGRWAVNWHESAAREAIKHRRLEEFYRDFDVNNTTLMRRIVSYKSVSDDIISDLKLAKITVGELPLAWYVVPYKDSAELALQNPEVLKIAFRGSTIAQEIAKIHADLIPKMMENPDIKVLLRR